MGHSSLLGVEDAPAEAEGRDALALGPSDSSDSGSDIAGIEDLDAADPTEPVDVALGRDVERPWTESDTLGEGSGDSTGTGERRSAGSDAGREAADISVDHVIDPSADLLADPSSDDLETYDEEELKLADHAAAEDPLSDEDEDEEDDLQ